MTAHRTPTFSQTFRVRYEECGPGGSARASTYLRYLQDLAFAHSAALGYPLSWYETHRLFWLMRRIHLVVSSGARYGEDLLCATQVLGMRRVLARRRSTVRRADGTPVAEAVADWIFTYNGAALARVPDDFAATFPVLGEALTPSSLAEPPAPAQAAWASVHIRASDADAMGHANHTVYIDLLDDAVTRAGGAEAVAGHPRTYDLQYHAPAAAGAVLRDVAWHEADLWSYRLETPEGRLIVHGRLLRSRDFSGRPPASA